MKFGGAVLEQFLLPLLAAVSLINHEFDPHLFGGGDYPGHEQPRCRLQQEWVTDSIHHLKPWIEGKHFGVKIPHK
jgi:hypothetical protein